MTIIHVTEATGGLPNSGRLSGTDGDLVGIFDVALPLNSIAIEFTSGTDRVYRSATGNRFRLTMRDAAAVSGSAQYATTRGAESASSATAYTDTFPLTTQFADANATWLKSSASNTTARNFDMYIGTTFVIYIVNFAGNANQWETFFFGDVPSALSGDSYNTWIAHRINTTAGSNFIATVTAGGSVSTRSKFTRSFDATVKSTNAAMVSYNNANLGGISGLPVYRAGPTTGVDRCKIPLSDGGQSATAAYSASLGLYIRAWLPNIWAPLHGSPGTATTRDTFTDTSYNASATFKIFVNVATANWIIIEETDTWTAPTG